MAQRQCLRSFTSTFVSWRTTARDETIRVRNQTYLYRRHISTPATHIIPIGKSNSPRSPLSSAASRQIQSHRTTRSIPFALSRTFTTTPTNHHGDLHPPLPGQERHITIIDKDAHAHTFTVGDGDNLLDIAQANDLEMEGACGGSCACSTCHVIVQDEAMYEKMEEPSDDENDMLDLAFGLTETSRLGCQVVMGKALDGLVVKLPSMTRNMQASDFAEKEKKG
ncbi:mitochondrial matrix iron-sulfur protein [Friedmanniomyces endolithicus]|uniref:Mitochondrial matrix iron-sulfur protein n=1 Tax=Friedmanniomyces endolithicus TaxID=329885 RepID=A0AAN6JX90_9PEZI|nr:mitochondrial matrix iron-sulfur protein [Friedmanniomyces endolithicus]KAK0296517.1 mitochondrial matrix iron-sulfur protein [Friedmanniomyces endolithicus]KAK0309829.1 mitochondrial matrix iron-sulfur protein [Friedmanniomyces endolithicus]KAK0324524.1 mitochondrial matrix iron-sulfur protein [Friedmanniomyces endolithicus]KAK0832839.1 mitochondrial matrix iron-sulfur protein [Friedmanniomyces endolithicus]